VVDWIDDVQTANTYNGSAQPRKVVPVQLVRPAEAVDDFWNGPSCIGVAHIVGEMVVLGTVPSLFFLFVVRKYIITYAVTLYAQSCQYFNDTGVTYMF